MEMLHPLYDPFPDAVLIMGKPCPVVTDFRHWIRFFDMLADETYSVSERMKCAMAWYLARPPCSVTEAYEALIRYASCADVPQTGRKGKLSATAVPLLSYTYDGAYIISDFLRYYQTDLTCVSMHWYKFRMLLEALPEESAVKTRVAYRSINLAQIKDKAQRKRIQKIKNSLWIPTDKKLTAGQIGAAFG